MLEKIRRRLRHAWLLHAWLIFSLLLLPAGRLARADGEVDVFTQTGTESLISVSVSAPEGITGLVPGTTRQVIVNVQQTTWEVWTGNPSGTIESRNSQSSAMSGQSVYFSMNGDGSLGGSTYTDLAGTCQATYTSGAGSSTISAQVAGGSGSITFNAPDPETWNWDRNESLLTASLTTTDATQRVPNGGTATVQVHADYSYWSIYNGSYGNTRTVYYGTSPAIGAGISWSVSNGDGTLATDANSLITDSSGNATATFTMGGADATVRADVSYGSSTATYATLSFTAAPVTETWMQTGTETTFSGVGLVANGSTDGLIPGTQRTVTAGISYEFHEVWTSSFGNTENRNSVTGPANGVGVSFGISAGDGSLTPGYATTGANGLASATFTMGSAASEVTASASNGSVASVGFNPAVETWQYSYSDGATWLASFGADDQVGDVFPSATRTLTASVQSASWEVWTSNFGNTTTYNSTTGPASGVNVSFSILSGDGYLTSTSVNTDSNGVASAVFYMGSSTTAVQVNAAGGTATLTLSPHVPQWSKVSTETTLTTVVSVDPALPSPSSGDTVPVTAQVLFHSWEVWQDDLGNTVNLNDAIGAAVGAPVTFSVEQGDGTVADTNGNQNPTATTDANGNATAIFRMGSNNGRLRADASYATATCAGTLDFISDGWTYSGPGSSLTVTLVADLSEVTATVLFSTWDIYAKGTESRIKHWASGPAGNAQVDFAGAGGATVPADDPAVGIHTVFTGFNGKAATPYATVVDPQAAITATVYFRDQSATAIIYLLQDTDGDGIPDLVEILYGLNPNDPSDAGSAHTVNGQTDGLTWKEANDQGYLDKLKPVMQGVEVSLSSGVGETGYWIGGGGTGEFTTSTASFSGNGSDSYSQTNPETGDIMVSYTDVLTGEELADYQQKEGLPDASPGQFDGSTWKTAWSDSVVDVKDADGETVRDGDDHPLKHGEWSGVLHTVTEKQDGAQWIKTGSAGSNDRLAYLPSPAPDVTDQFEGKYYGNQAYTIADMPSGDNETEITPAKWSQLRPQWLDIDTPAESTRAKYPAGGSLSAGTSSDETSASKCVIWIKTEDGNPATETIVRSYIKTTTDIADPSNPNTELVQLTIPKNKKTSETITLAPAPGKAENLLPLDIIQIDAFIPEEWLYEPITVTGSFINNGNSRKTPLDGDNYATGPATFDVNSKEYKAQQTIGVTAFSNLDPGNVAEMATKTTTVGETREYSASVLVNGHIPATATPLQRKTATPSIDSVEITHVGSSAVIVHMECQASDPIAHGAMLAPLHWDIYVSISRLDPTKPTYRVWGTHCRFPAYEIYINGQAVHQFDPVSGGFGPWSITRFDRSFDNSGALNR